MQTVFLITGNTYIYRREIKSLGGKWNPENKGWIVPLVREQQVKELVEKYGLELSSIETEDINLETPTGERLRAIRQAKLDRRIVRLEAKAARLDAEGERKKANLQRFHGDIAFFTQPATPSSTFGRYRQRIRDKYLNGVGLQVEAADLQEQADWLKGQTARIKGDAERERQAKRDAMDNLVTVGTRLLYPPFARPECTVLKVNKKTYTVKFDNGRMCTLEKSFLSY